MIGCPKFDDTNAYQEKLQQIITTMAPASITVVRMEVPCCGGIARMVLAARDQVNPTLPVHVHTITTKGESNVLLSM
jgi:hypothetical protein